MKKFTWKAGITALSLLMVACSGSDENQNNQNNNENTSAHYELTVKLIGLNDESVSFDWLGKPYSANANITLTDSSSSYSPPDNIIYPDNYNCNSQTNQLTKLSYELLIECEGDIDNEMTRIEIQDPLPYRVNIKLQEQIYKIQHDSIQIENATLSSPQIISVEGPLLCELQENKQIDNTWDLHCEEYLIAAETTGYKAELEHYLITNSKKIALNIRSSSDEVATRVYTHLETQWFTINNNLYFITLENGQFKAVEKSSTNLTSLAKNNDTLYGLNDDGLYQLTDNLEWIKIKPITRKLASSLYLSDHTLSWLTENHQSLVLDRLVSQVIKSPTYANEEAITSSEHAAIAIDNGTVWLAKNAQSQWILIAVEVNGHTFGQVIQTLPEETQFAIWQQEDLKNTLLMIEDNKILSFVIEEQTMTWQPIKETSANIIAANQQILVSAKKLSNDQASLINLHLGSESISQDELTSELNLTASPLLALNENDNAFSQIKLTEPWLLFYVDGDVWITGGTIENSQKVLSNFTWEQFKMLNIITAGKSILLLEEFYDKNQTIHIINI
ncbi:hypothetical protein [uncultured Shewanella sp.]|uniref:hypothetical protein n=1 Tax=uncultured Shewanella sp. TaxID=173975 RepID=UPI00260D3017|nr:hypothetical protein [uncultured Shewanella sp.]